METSQTDRELNAHGSGHERARYTTLADYLRVVRQHRLLIALVALPFIAAAVIYSLTETKSYVATTQVAVRDPLADLNLVGVQNVATGPTPDSTQLPATNAELVTSPKVTSEALEILEDEALAGTVSARVGVQTNLIVIEAAASSPTYAARLADAFGAATVNVRTEQQQDRLRRVEDAIKGQMEAQESGPTTPTEEFSIAILHQELTRIRALREIARPAEIVEKATVPGSPVSPKPLRNTLLGGLVGLAFGLLAAFVRDSLDRRIRTAHDVNYALGAPVLSRVNLTALGQPGLAANGSPPMNSVDFEAFRTLRMNLGSFSNGQPVRSVVVTSSVPEEGKTTVSMALASASVLAGQRTLLVECDLRKPSFAARLGCRPKPGLTDYLLGRADPKEILQTVDLTSPNEFGNAAPKPKGSTGTLVCVAAGSPAPNPAELLVGDKFKDFVDKVTRAYDFVILDSSPLLPVTDPLALIPLVDGILFCVRASRTTRDEVHAARGALSHLPERPLGAVLTGLRTSDRDSYGYYRYGY